MPTKGKKDTKAATGKKDASRKGGPASGETAQRVLGSSMNYQKALEAFEKAFAQLGQKDYRKAAEGFRAILEEFAAEIDVADRARTYLKVCDRALGDAPAPPENLEGLYLQGVVEMNHGRYDRALSLFDKALATKADHEGALYASAVALAQVGRKADAMSRLRRSIDVSGQNRILALNDPDFECVRDEPEFIDLVEPEESRGTERRQL